MRQEIIRKNLSLTVITILLFFVISLFITSYFNKKNIENNLINISSLIKEQITKTNTDEEVENVVNSYTNQQNWIEVVVINSHGTIIYHSASDEINRELPQKEINLMNRPNDLKTVYTSGNSVFIIFKVNDDIYVKTSLPLTSETTFILSSLFYLLILIVIFFMISYYLNNQLASKIIKTFGDIETHLKNINTNEYQEIDTGSEFEEVSKSLKEINVISENISTLIDTIQQEKDKVNHVVDKMQQGLFVINKDLEVLMINEYAKNVLNVNNNLESRHVSDIFTDNLIIENIKQSLDNKLELIFDVWDDANDKVYAYDFNYVDTKWDIDDIESGVLICLIIDVTVERKDNELKAEFITNATHELKTPITSISGFAELLSKGLVKNEDKKTEYLEKINRSAMDMKVTVENLLFLSNLGNPGMISLNENVILDDVINKSLEKYHDELQESKIKVIKNLNNVCTIGNEVLISYMVNNLIENAIRYNRINGLIIVSTTTTENNQILSISDNGIGIEQKNLNKIFERFYRTTYDGSQSLGSTGIGLSIVERVAKVHGAKIEVESEINVGSKFTIIFNKKRTKEKVNEKK